MTFSGRYAGILVAAVLAVTSILSGCREDDANALAVNPSLTNVVTFNGNNEQGAEFSYIRIDDTPELKLQSNVALDTAVARKGDRMVIRYLPPEGDADASGTITLQGAARINSAKVSVDSIARYPQWDRDGVYVYSLWRTGRYINLHGLLPYDEAPRQFMVIADYATADSAEVHLYLVHQLKEVINTHLRAYYASFDISEVWDRPTCKSVALHIENTNLTDCKVFYFSKTCD